MDRQCGRKLSIAIVGEHLLVHDALSILLRHPLMEVVVASDVDELHDRVAEANSKLHALLFDLDEPSHRPDQLSSLELIRQRLPALRILGLSDRISLERIARCLHTGLEGLLLKSTSPAVLIKSLRLIMVGGTVFPKELVGWLTERSFAGSYVSAEAAAKLQSLSTREVAVIKGLLAGQTNKEIARELRVAEGTVKVHLRTINRKLNVRTRTQAALWAAKNMPEAAAFIADREVGSRS